MKGKLEIFSQRKKVVGLANSGANPTTFEFTATTLALQ
jgi:hypothetical protein